MKLTNYKYGNTEFTLDISKVQDIVKDGSKRFVIFLKCGEHHIINFVSTEERDKAYNDILNGGN